MKTTTKLIATLGVAAGLGVASLPVAGAFAGSTATSEFSVKVNDYLSISGSTAGGTPEINHGESTEDIVATLVATNNNSVGYTITVKDFDSDNSLTGSNGDSILAAASGAGWCIKGGSMTGCNVVPVSTGAPLVVQSKTGAHINGDSTEITYHIQARDNQTAGTYSGKVVYTIAPKS